METAHIITTKTLLSNQEFKKIIPDQNFSLLEVFKDTFKNTNFYLLASSQKVLVLKIEKNDKLLIKNELIFEEGIKELSLSSLSYCVFLNRIYLISSLCSGCNNTPNNTNTINTSSVYMIDMEKKKLFTIQIDPENNLEICKNNSFVFIDTKLVFTGGINCLNKLNNLITSFDISTYKFENEKIKENNMIARHSHGSMSVGEFIYIIGGFTSIEEDDNKICNVIQLVRFDNLINNWLTLDLTGNKPEMMIRPQFSIIGSEFLLAFSSYKYSKAWYLNVKTNVGSSIDLSYLNLDISNYLNVLFSYSYEENKEKKDQFNLLHFNEENNLIKSNFSLALN